MSIVDALLARPPGAAVREPASGPAPRVCLLACSDPAHSAQLEALAPPGAVVLRAPGPVLAPDGELARAAAAAVLLHGCTEVVVLAHTGCSLTGTDTAAALAAVTGSGVARAAIPGDVRSFFNLHPSPRQLALDSARALRAVGCLPPRTLVHALLFDEATGELGVVERGENAELRSPAGIGLSPSARPESGPTSTFEAPLPLGLGVGLESTLANPSGPVDMGAGLRLEARPLGSSLEALPRLQIEISEDVAVRSAPTMDDGLAAIAAGPSPAVPVRAAPTMEEGLAAIAAGPSPIRPTETARPAPPQPPPASPRGRAGAAQPPKRAQPEGAAAARRALRPELLGNLERVRDFYRAEIELRSRREIASALQRAAAAGAANPELIRIVLKPLLDLGPKRYKVLDELLALKQAGLEMSREDLQYLLGHVID